MLPPTILFLGKDALLYQKFDLQVNGRFCLQQVAPPYPAGTSPLLANIRMLVVKDDSEWNDLPAFLRQCHRTSPDVPVVVFTDNFSGSNTRTLLKSGAVDVFPAVVEPDIVLACCESYLPGFQFARLKHKKRPSAKSPGFLMTAAATGMMVASPGLATLQQQDFQPINDRKTEQPESPTPGWELKYFGFFSIKINGKSIHLANQANMIFAYLAYHHPRAFNRDHLARVFWPDKHDNQPECARRSLNVELTAIRKALRAQTGSDQDFIVFDKNQYKLELKTEIHSDISEFRQSCKMIQSLYQASLPIPDEVFQRAIQAYTGGFLEDCPPDTISWVEVERQRLSAIFEQIAEQYSAQLFNEGNYWKATAVCHEILSFDLNMEVIHRRLMQCYASLGMGNKMEAQFKLLCHILKSKFSSKPSVETVRVYDDIKREIAQQ